MNVGLALNLLQKELIHVIKVEFLQQMDTFVIRMVFNCFYLVLALERRASTLLSVRIVRI